jgi:hypothetical protein
VVIPCHLTFVGMGLITIQVDSVYEGGAPP